jgi:protein SCO1/2
MPYQTAGIVIALTATLAACSRAKEREYELRGQIIAIDQARQMVTITHEDIPRFMPGMTMAFKVSEKGLLEGRTPGELIKATLVVRETDAHLRTLERTGVAPLTEAPPPPAPDLVAPGTRVRDAAFVDQSEASRTLADWRGRVLAVTFMYTRCPIPDYCPLMDRHFRAVQDQVRADAKLYGRVHLLSITLDPQHDTPAVLSGHAKKLGADPAVWTLLTGEMGELRNFGAQFGVGVLPADKADAEIVHSLRTAIVDGDGRLITAMSGNDWVPADLLRELRNAIAGR